MSLDLCGDVVVAARSLLGATLRHGEVAVRIAEVEAYGGESDPASHAARGRTPRTAVMFGPAGRLYVYFSYGMHWAANIVCGPDGTASGVLLRSGQVIDGVDLARARRGGVRELDLARGPARLAQALGISGDHLGLDVLGHGLITLSATTEAPPRIATGRRVGVSVEADRRWRFWIADDRYVSTYRRSPRAPRPLD